VEVLGLFVKIHLVADGGPHFLRCLTIVEELDRCAVAELG
jgi:hypothetical protein